MAYYDRLVNNPDAALDEIAERNGETRESMAERLAAIRASAADGNHITLSQAKSFFDEDAVHSDDIIAHVDSCNYCQNLLDGLNPATVRKNIEVTFERTLQPQVQPAAISMAAAASSEPLAAQGISSRQKAVFGGSAIAATVVAFWGGSVFSTMQLSNNESYMPISAMAEQSFAVSDPAEVASLNFQIDELSSRYARLLESNHSREAISNSPWTVVRIDEAGNGMVTLERTTAEDSSFENFFSPGEEVILIDQFDFAEAVHNFDNGVLQRISSDPDASDLSNESAAEIDGVDSALIEATDDEEQ